MKQQRTSKYVLLVAIVMLSAGFLIGISQQATNFIINASENDQPKYTGNQMSSDTKPESALNIARELENAFAYAIGNVQPAVVTIFTRKEVRQQRPGGPQFRDPFFDRFFDDFFQDHYSVPREVRNLGSGMIIREDGYILTNNHVVDQADEIEVQLANEQQVKAELIGSDPQADLAVIKIDMQNLPAVTFANSDSVKTGQWALAIGAPFQLKNSVSIGHVSATHRAIDSMRYEDFIQTDAAINQGNSGGPLVNIEGEVIGLNTMIISSGMQQGNVGIGFAISSNMARRTASDLIEYGEVRRPWLGIMIQQLTPEMADKFEHDRGVLIAEVTENSPAEEAGLQQGDLVIDFDGEPVTSPHDLQRKVLASRIGQEVTLTVDRAGAILKIKTELDVVPNGDRRPTAPLQTDEDILSDMGLSLKEIPDEQAHEEYGIRPARTALLVEKVEHGSLAHRHGLESGTLIVEVDRREITSLDDFATYLEQQQQEGKTSVLFLLRQRDHFIYRLVPLP